VVILNKSKEDMEKMAEAVLRGSLALQATPMLKASGRTPTALARTATGYAGIGIAGAMAQTAFGMVKPRNGLGKKKKKKHKGGK
jgi:hypothetical protein